MLQFFKNTKYNFLRYAKIAVCCSVAFIAVSVASVAMHRGFNMSIDFAGGTTVHLKFEKPVRDELSAIRNAVSALNFGAPEIKTIGPAEQNELQITVRSKTEDVNTVVDALRGALEGEMAGNAFTVLRIENVGPKIGGELTRDAVIASVLALISILVYVGLRFKLSYAVASVIPLFHDVCITLGVFSLMNLELTLPFLAAVMTVIGYSLNDTIVVFDRIRENVKGGLRGKAFNDVVNASLNQTLSRTIITSGTTFLTVMALYILGSDSIKDFALALAIGVAIGTYSTLFIAAPMLGWWNKKWPIAK
ncbi:MAG: protein translocase subunit SecF [Chitinispirillales bacterium]|jgi:preprotein translocase subunit SecF|nr:protein translocase subunit SecF [Chitinispirillales bacterium]